MATLPKPRYPSAGPNGPPVWPTSRIYPVTPKRPLISASSSLLGLQAQAPVLPYEPVQAEPGVIARLWSRLIFLGVLLRAVAAWWMEADFRSRQVPVLVVALGIWGMTARAAWRSQESGTPLLLQSISKIRQEQARAAINAGIAPAHTSSGIEPAPAAPVSSGASARVEPVSPAPADIQKAAPSQNSSFPALLAASLRSWFSVEPASAEKVHGNPRRRVWVDMKTGLYYCPGAAHYGLGGRSRGKVMRQKDAEYEYFQAAAGAPCR